MNVNKLLGAGDEQLRHQLAGFATLADDGGSSGGRGASGFAVLPVIEGIARAAAAAATGGGGGGATSGGGGTGGDLR